MGQAPRELTPSLSALHFFGAELRHWRTTRGLSQDALGQLTHDSGALISKIEKAARRPTDRLARQCDEILNTGGVLQRLLPLIEQEATDQEPGPRQHHTHRPQQTHDQQQQTTLQRGLNDIGQPTPNPLADLALAEDLLEPLATTSGRRIGQGTVRALAVRVHRLRLADDVLAGGDLIVPAFRHLLAARKLHRESSYAEVTGRDLLVQIGELAQIAGWIASDAGRHETAERAYNIGLSAARQVGDRTLAANLAGSLAYQYANTGREREGVNLARSAVEEAGPDAGAKARALFLDRVAWAHARVGEAQPALRALGEAHDALARDRSDDAPQWAYWVSQDELEVMDARVFTELRRPLRAVPLLSTVLRRYDATHTREMALYLSWLATAYAEANEPEAAADTTAQMLDLSDDLASARTSERTRVVLRTLMRFADVPEVRTLLSARVAR